MVVMRATISYLGEIIIAVMGAVVVVVRIISMTMASPRDANYTVYTAVNWAPTVLAVNLPSRGRTALILMNNARSATISNVAGQKAVTVIATPSLDRFGWVPRIGLTNRVETFLAMATIRMLGSATTPTAVLVAVQRNATGRPAHMSIVTGLASTPARPTTSTVFKGTEDGAATIGLTEANKMAATLGCLGRGLTVMLVDIIAIKRTTVVGNGRPGSVVFLAAFSTTKQRDGTVILTNSADLVTTAPVAGRAFFIPIDVAITNMVVLEAAVTGAEVNVVVTHVSAIGPVSRSPALVIAVTKITMTNKALAVVSKRHANRGTATSGLVANSPDIGILRVVVTAITATLVAIFVDMKVASTKMKAKVLAVTTVSVTTNPDMASSKVTT